MTSKWTELEAAVEKKNKKLAEAHRDAHRALCRAEVARRKAGRTPETEQAVADGHALRNQLRAEMLALVPAEKKEPAKKKLELVPKAASTEPKPKVETAPKGTEKRKPQPKKATATTPEPEAQAS